MQQAHHCCSISEPPPTGIAASPWWVEDKHKPLAQARQVSSHSRLYLLKHEGIFKTEGRPDVDGVQRPARFPHCLQCLFSCSFCVVCFIIVCIYYALLALRRCCFRNCSPSGKKKSKSASCSCTSSRFGPPLLGKLVDCAQFLFRCSASSPLSL